MKQNITNIDPFSKMLNISESYSICDNKCADERQRLFCWSIEETSWNGEHVHGLEGGIAGEMLDFSRWARSFVTEHNVRHSELKKTVRGCLARAYGCVLEVKFESNMGPPTEGPGLVSVPGRRH